MLLKKKKNPTEAHAFENQLMYACFMPFSRNCLLQLKKSNSENAREKPSMYYIAGTMTVAQLEDRLKKIFFSSIVARLQNALNSSTVATDGHGGKS